MRFASCSSLRLAVALAALILPFAASAQVTPPPVGACSSTPLSCWPGKGKLKANVLRRTLSWKWTGAGVSISNVENPVLETGYDFCIYDASGALVLATGVPPGGYSWRARGWGFQYHDPSGLNGGVTKIMLRVAGGRDRLTVAGTGTSLLLGIERAALPLTVQLIRTDPLTCWSAPATRLR